ncbi:nucleotidyltransferase domain-containing protein, partial [Rhodospirillum rubrum]
MVDAVTSPSPLPTLSRPVADSLGPAAARAVAAFAEAEGVSLPHAALTGPLAWGLPDDGVSAPVVCACVFIRPAQAYLGLVEPPDILHLDATDDMPAVVGWDARRVLRMALRSNAVVWEWLASPVIDGPGARADFREAFLALATRGYARSTLLGHYLGVAKAAMNAYFPDEPREAARIKYMHTLRALMAVDWILGKNAPPPPDWARLRAGASLPAEAAPLLDALEVGPPAERRHPVLDGWIDSVFEASRAKGGDLSD